LYHLVPGYQRFEPALLPAAASPPDGGHRPPLLVKNNTFINFTGPPNHNTTIDFGLEITVDITEHNVHLS